LFMLVMFESTLVKQQQRNMSEIRNMGNKGFAIQCYRYNKWTSISSEELLPGDIVSLRSAPKTPAVTRNQAQRQPNQRQQASEPDERLAPCDLVLLSGRVICDESLLTGESVPQVKEGIDQLDMSSTFNENENLVSVINGGTKILQFIPAEKGNLTGALRPTDKGCPALVVRTGFSTTQGQLLRTILYGSKRVTANNKETGLFIAILLSFAIAASYHLYTEGSKDETKSKFKLLLECTYILTSVVPPELPIQLSLAVNTSLLALHKLGLFCTEPFRIPYAGKIDIVCFDKTGTLTQDEVVIDGVAGVGDDHAKVIPVIDLPPETTRVLAGAHALHMSDDKQLVGDPLEIRILKDINWSLKGDSCTPLVRSRENKALKIEKKYYFSSALARMSTVVSHETDENGSKYTAVIKGSAETIRARLNVVPEWYERTHKKLAKDGYRVLALGSRSLKYETRSEMVQADRDEIERNFNFRGFLVTASPLKEDTTKVINALKESSHYVTMITGDAQLTAVHVARKTDMIVDDEEKIYTLEDRPEKSDFVWRRLDEEIEYPAREFPADDLCVSGKGFTWISENLGDEFLRKLIPKIRVFARVSPRQKETIICELKAAGFHTVMCGDGTNDVGALRQSHVGVALLSQTVGEKLDKQQVYMKKQREIATYARLGQHRIDQNQQLKESFDKLMKEMEDMEGPQFVQLGDASIAAPFTSRKASPSAVLHVIKQGRCTLVTTLQMFSILALNSLISAYAQSALYLKGIKFSDGQYTLLAFLIALCFLFISRAEPLDKLSRRRPLPNIFNIYSVTTVLVQFAVHFSCLYAVVKRSEEQMPPADGPIDLESEFEKSLLNSAVYIISLSMQVNTLAVNYRGAPFMTPFMENKQLSLSLGGVGLFSLALASNMFPWISSYFSIITFPAEFSDFMTQVVLFDFFGAYSADKLLQYFFGYGSLRAL